MAKAEILSRIKEAEAEAKASVQKALEEKDKRIADATTEAANIVSNAEAEAQAFFDKRLAEADTQIKEKKQTITASGVKNTESLKAGASSKLDAAVEYLYKEFMGLLHA